MPSPPPAVQEDAGQSRIRVALDAFFKISETWGLSADEQIILLGSPGRSTFFKWKKESGSIPADTLERISHIISIYKALEILLPDPKQADGWIKRANKYFDGQSALDVMLGGSFVDVYRVRQYVDAQRGG